MDWNQFPIFIAVVAFICAAIPFYCVGIMVGVALGEYVYARIKHALGR